MPAGEALTGSNPILGAIVQKGKLIRKDAQLSIGKCRNYARAGRTVRLL